MTKFFALIIENKNLAVFSLVLTVTVLGFVIASLWAFKQPNLDSSVGYICQLLAGLFVIVSKLAYTAGAEKSQYMK
jgi:hypothetical protein